MRSLPALLLFLALTSCASAPSTPWPDAAGAVAHPALARLSVELWDEVLRQDPVEAGRLGDARFLAALPDLRPQARAERQEAWRAHADSVGAIDADELTARDAETLAMARHLISERLIHAEVGLGTWLLSPNRGVHTFLWNLSADQPVGTSAERDALVRRWAAMPRYVEQARRNFLAALENGKVANRRAVQASVEQLDKLLAEPTESWAVASPGAELDPLARRALQRRVLPGLERRLRPALRRLRDTLRDEVLPAARSDDAPGLAALPGGTEDYARLARAHTGLDMPPSKIHQIGLTQIAKVRDEMVALGESLFGTTTLASLQERLRTDPSLYFETREEVEGLAVAALARAEAGLDGWFGRRPEASCTVVRIAPHEEAHSTIAYYRGPAVDGSAPGRYFINTYAPPTRPRFDAEVLAFHEAVPGHHLQIAIAQELPGVPLFQRNTGTTGFVEGWALYTERLCDEMGLYSSDLDRLGMLSFDAWRASRLVVDTGLHDQGWSRDKAIAYLEANTLMSHNNAVVEVDRYIANPGQALAYKLGQLAILGLRETARERLGERFDVADFHDVALSAGAVTLELLEQRVMRWIDAGGGALSSPDRDGPVGTW